jgi:hypothetical protein
MDFNVCVTWCHGLNKHCFTRPDGYDLYVQSDIIKDNSAEDCIEIYGVDEDIVNPDEDDCVVKVQSNLKVKLGYKSCNVSIPRAWRGVFGGWKQDSEGLWDNWNSTSYQDTFEYATRDSGRSMVYFAEYHWLRFALVSTPIDRFYSPLGLYNEYSTNNLSSIYTFTIRFQNSGTGIKPLIVVCASGENMEVGAERKEYKKDILFVIETVRNMTDVLLKQCLTMRYQPASWLNIICKSVEADSSTIEPLAWKQYDEFKDWSFGDDDLYDCDPYGERGTWVVAAYRCSEDVKVDMYTQHINDRNMWFFRSVTNLKEVTRSRSCMLSKEWWVEDFNSIAKPPFAKQSQCNE